MCKAKWEGGFRCEGDSAAEIHEAMNVLSHPDLDMDTMAFALTTIIRGIPEHDTEFSALTEAMRHPALATLSDTQREHVYVMAAWFRAQQHAIRDHGVQSTGSVASDDHKRALTAAFDETVSTLNSTLTTSVGGTGAKHRFNTLASEMARDEVTREVEAACQSDVTLTMVQMVTLADKVKHAQGREAAVAAMMRLSRGTLGEEEARQLVDAGPRKVARAIEASLVEAAKSDEKASTPTFDLRGMMAGRKEPEPVPAGKVTTHSDLRELF